jgi:hypothetical protein
MEPIADPTARETTMTDPDNLPAETAKRIREDHARHYAKERQRDARRLAAYEAECLASWGE